MYAFIQESLQTIVDELNDTETVIKVIISETEEWHVLKIGFYNDEVGIATVTHQHVDNTDEEQFTELASQVVKSFRESMEYKLNRLGL